MAETARSGTELSGVKSCLHHLHTSDFWWVSWPLWTTTSSFFNVKKWQYICHKIYTLVQFNRSVMSNSLSPDEPQHSRPLCPSPTPRVNPNPCPSSWWCHPTISSSVVPFSSCPQSFPASGSFQISHLSASGGHSIGDSASASVLPMNCSGSISFRIDWLGLLAVQGTLKSLLQHHSSKASILWLSAFFIVQLSHPYMTTGKTKALTRWTFVGNVSA